MLKIEPNMISKIN